MTRTLAAWLFLLVGALLLLRWCAALWGPKPPSELGERSLFDKILKSKKNMVFFVLAVAVGMSVLLAALALVFTVVLNIEFGNWAGLLERSLKVAIGIVMVGLYATVSRDMFTQKWQQLVAPGVVVVTAIAWVIWPNWLTADLLTLIGITCTLYAYLTVTLNFKIVALMGGGLFIFDVVNVYFTGNMQRVAMPMMDWSLPGMIVVPQSLAFDAPYIAGLGNGDIVFPGVMILLAAALSYKYRAMSVLRGGLIGYAVGLVAVFGILYLTHKPQPALIGLYPCVLAGILLAARRAGLWHELFAMRHAKPVHTHGRDCSCDEAVCKVATA